jgi:hypothetical protein
MQTTSEVLVAWGWNPWAAALAFQDITTRVKHWTELDAADLAALVESEYHVVRGWMLRKARELDPDNILTTIPPGGEPIFVWRN